MVIGSIGGAAANVAQEAQETRAVTRQEAAKGDRIAQRKLAKEEAAQAAQQVPAASDEGAETAKGTRVKVVA